MKFPRRVVSCCKHRHQVPVTSIPDLIQDFHRMNLRRRMMADTSHQSPRFQFMKWFSPLLFQASRTHIQTQTGSHSTTSITCVAFKHLTLQHRVTVRVRVRFRFPRDRDINTTCRTSTHAQVQYKHTVISHQWSNNDRRGYIKYTPHVHHFFCFSCY